MLMPRSRMRHRIPERPQQPGIGGILFTTPKESYGEEAVVVTDCVRNPGRDGIRAGSPASPSTPYSRTSPPISRPGVPSARSAAMRRSRPRPTAWPTSNMASR